MKLLWAVTTLAVAACGQAMGTFARGLRLSAALADGRRFPGRHTARARSASEAGRRSGPSRATAASPPREKPIGELLQRAQGEFLEMPGLRLTPAQAQRLWGLRSSTCDMVLTMLLEKRFLRRTRDGAFVLESPR